MFCMFCGGNVSPNTNVCPECGKTLDAHSRVLNPIPRKVIEIDESSISEDFTDPADSETIELCETPTEEYVESIESEDNTSETKLAGPSTIQLNYGINNSVQQDAPHFEEAKDTDEEPVQDIHDSVENSSHKSTVVIVCVALLAIAAIVGATILIKKFITKEGSSKNSTSITENSSINDTATSSEASATDAIQSTEQLDLKEDTLVIKKNITIDEKEYNTENLTHYTDTNNSVDVTVCEFVLTQAEAQRYMDEQEVKYQLQDASILDVAYVGGVYRYHYDGLYQYGLYNDGSLYMYEIKGSLDSESCDNLALEYFSTLEVSDEK